MSCSLKSSKDMLNEFGIITKFNEIVDIDALQKFEENLFESIGDEVAYINAIGNPFFIQKLGNKSKLEFNRSFFEILDTINNQRVYDSQSLDGEKSELSIDELTNEQLLEFTKIDQREKYDDAFRRWYESENVGLNSPEAIDKNEILDQTRKSNSSGANQLEESIKKMNDVFDVKVILDKSIPLLGELLPVNHPISIQSGKPVILINPDLANQETVFHEFAHLYIDLLGGSKNQTVRDAYELLAGTDLFKETAGLYPELSPEMLNREVLASAMGMQADEIFGKELSDISSFNRIVNKIMEFISNILGIDKNAVYELSKELVTGKLQKTNIEEYNTTISQKQKIKVDAINHASVTNFVETVLRKNELKETATDRFYSIGQSGTTQVARESTTDFVKNKIHVRGFEYSSRKGDINKKFVLEDYNAENLFLKLNETTIPLALDKALNDKFKKAKYIAEGSNDTWESIIRDENFLDTQRRKEKIQRERESTGFLDLMDIDEDESDKTPAAQYISDNLDSILKLAHGIQGNFDRPAVAGTVFHGGAEEFVNTGEIPDNIEQEDTAFFDYLDNLLKTRRADGSKFYTEVSIYDELNQLPGTIDLLEIDKEGKFIIHDFKTTKTFVSKYGNHAKKDEELFLYKGYVAQLMVYGKILENYGLVPAENPFNLIATEISYGNLKLDEDNEIVIKGLRTMSFNKSERGQKGIKGRMFEIDQKVNKQLRGRQLELSGVVDKTAAQEYADLIDKVRKDLKIFNRLSAKNRRNIDSSSIKQLDKLFTEIEENKANSEKAKIRISANALINSIAEQMKVLENVIHSGEQTDFDKDYMYSLRYILQASDNVIELKKIMDRDQKNEIGFLDKAATSADLSNIISNIETSKEYYKQQVFNHAAYELANNSNYQIGVYSERFNIELKKAGVANKEERKMRVEKLLAENRYEIFDAEYKYWKKQYSEGILDLRGWEYQMADPGISKSQFVQVTKNLIDKASQDKRLDLDFIIPKIVSWNENITYNKSGSTREIWKDLLENRQVKDLDGKIIKDLNGSVIPQWTSDYREDMFTFTTQREHYYDLLREINNKSKKTAEDVSNAEKITKLLEELHADKVKLIEKKSKNKTYKTLRENPAYTSLSEEKKKDLQFIHKNLRDADARIFNNKLKLTNYFGDKDEISSEDVESGKGAYIYNLPRRRMTFHESAQGLKSTVKNIGSKAKDLLRQSADDDEARFEEENLDDAKDVENDAKSFNGSMSDIENNEIFDVPVYYRNSLGMDRDLQSYDIPSLLADNHDTTITYQANKGIEADLFMISESLRLSENMLKTDSLSSQKVFGVYNRPRKSDQNFVLQAVKSQINNRIYGRHFSGVYSKGNYQTASTIGLLKNVTSISVLTGNFMSALNTAGSGSIYRFIEGEAGEHFDRKDWMAGSKKTYSDAPNMLADTQKYHPTSKTALLIRMLGMDNQYKALANKFVQKNFASKNLDQSALFALTSLSETNITAHLMYSLTNGIKMMNKNGEYIDVDGKVVSKEDAMTFDEAYEVKDGVLELNKHVAYTSKDPVNKLSSDGEVNRIALARVSGFAKSVYADLFGQYDSELKSVLETNVYGGALMSMKKWLPRGLNRRFRGIGGLIESTKNLRDFDAMHSEENREDRFYSQDKMNFEEGSFVTAARYVRLLSKELRKTGSTLAMMEKNKELRLSMTDHEIANLHRAAKESVAMIALFALKTMLLALAESIGDDPRDKMKQERAYFAAYLSLKLYHEYNSFVNPFSLAKTVTDPSVPAGQLFKIADLGDQLFLFSYDKDSPLYFSPNVLQINESGAHEGDLKAVSKFKSTAIPGYRNFSMATGLLGIDDDPDYFISDSYKFYAKNNK
jgi:hypothetical protein